MKRCMSKSKLHIGQSWGYEREYYHCRKRFVRTILKIRFMNITYREQFYRDDQLKTDVEKNTARGAFISWVNYNKCVEVSAED